LIITDGLSIGVFDPGPAEEPVSAVL